MPQSTKDSQSSKNLRDGSKADAASYGKMLFFRHRSAGFVPTVVLPVEMV